MSYIDWMVFVLLLFINLGIISVIIGVPGITIWALYLKLTGKGNEPSRKYLANQPTKEPLT